MLDLLGADPAGRGRADRAARRRPSPCCAPCAPHTPRRAARTWDILVVDLPPTPEAVALLALPEQLRRYLRRLLPARAAGRPRAAARARPARRRADARAGLYDAADALGRRTGRRPGRRWSRATTVRLVAEPGPLAAGALRTARAGLRLHGLALESVVANRLLPTGTPPTPGSPRSPGSSRPRSRSCASSAHGRTGLRTAAPGTRSARPRRPVRRIATPPGDAPGRPPDGGLRGRARPPAPDAAPAAPRAADPRPAARRRRRAGWVEDRLAEDGILVWRLPLPGATGTSWTWCGAATN